MSVETRSHSPRSDDPSAQRPYIRIGEPEVYGGTLISRVSYHERMDRFLASGLFYAKYDFSLAEVPPSVLSIPVMGLLAPLAWVTGAEVVAGDLDADYVDSLGDVLKEFKGMYPSISFSGEARAHRVPTPHGWDHGKYCALYSGGLDSTCTLIRNLAKTPSAFMVRGGPDIPLQADHYWHNVQEKTLPFLKGLGVESHLVETNALGMVNQDAIRMYLGGKLRSGWWEELAFGLFLLSLSAPYTYAKGIGNIMIGSSNTAQDQIPWGSTPMSDEKVRWGGVRVIHDSYDLTRLDKIRKVVLPYAVEHGEPVPLRVCIGRRSILSETEHLNCGECAKCFMVGMTLMLLGAEVAESGFDFSPGALSRLRRGLENGRFGRNYDSTAWAFIKAGSKSPPAEIVSKYPGLREFLDWFGAWDERATKPRSLVDRVAPPGSRRRDLARAGFGKKGRPDLGS